MFRYCFALLSAAQIALLLAMTPGCSSAQATRSGVARRIDRRLAEKIAAIRAIDNHAHPVLPACEGCNDRDFDALPVDGMEPQTDIVAWRADNPQLSDAWMALWGFKGRAPLDDAGMKQLGKARVRVRSLPTARSDGWVLERSGIEIALANRVKLGPGVTPPDFRWVPYADALLFPLDNSRLAASTPDRSLFFPMEDQVRKRYLDALHLQSAPKSLAEYLQKVVTPTLERQQTEGAVAEKFEVAYLRGFDVSDVTVSSAAEVYRRWIDGGQPDTAAYKQLQDFLFRYIAQECGRLGMAVHLHTMSGGGGYFDIAGANPLLLEPLLNDSNLRKTTFVLLHGGWPFVREAGALLQKPNVFLDLSQQSLSFPPATLAVWLREWLETFPEKVLFGTDGYPFSASMGWEESTWIASRNAREALGLALTGMLLDGEISRRRADDIAAMVLRGNAAKLYHLP